MFGEVQEGYYGGFGVPIWVAIDYDNMLYIAKITSQVSHTGAGSSPMRLACAKGYLYILRVRIIYHIILIIYYVHVWKKRNFMHSVVLLLFYIITHTHTLSKNTS